MIAACLDCGLASIEQRSQWLGPIPPEVTAHARRAASSGVSLTTALCRCVAAYSLVWGFVLDDVADHPPPGQQTFVLLHQVSAALAAVLARVQAEIADAQSAEITRRSRSREQRRAEIVRRLLACERVDSSELAELDYQLDVWHVALIATGAKAKEAVRHLASELGRQVLLIQHNEATMWTWLGSPHRPAFDDIERVYAKLSADAPIAVGEPGRGVDGWRTSHCEARGALLVARERPTRITRYLDVALEAVALQDEALADSLIEKYLLPLEAVSIGGQMARKTVRALFDAEHNVSSAANTLNAHRSSVHRWREQIEQRLGYRLHEHQAEIETALRVDELRRHSTPIV
jgi:sugar diacid utilization regulator